MTSTRTATLASLVGLVALVGLTGCGSGGGSNASASDAGGAARDSTTSGEVQSTSPLADSGTFSATGSAAGKAAGSGAGSDLVQQRIIKNGDVAITTPDPQQARDRVDALLVRLHGALDDEQTVYDKAGKIHDSQLVLRVPVASFETAMTALQHLGTVVHSNSSGKDVTSQVIDVQQRLRTLRISLHDLNGFQSHAANIDQLLRFENAITVRRGEYQSLKAQRNHLLSQTSMSTIDLDISVPPTKVTPVVHHSETGFLTGLRHGWSAFTGTVMVSLTAIGAVLPFAVVLAAIGVPLWIWWRRRTTTGPPPEPAPAD